MLSGVGLSYDQSNPESICACMRVCLCVTCATSATCTTVQRLVVRFDDRWVDLTGWRKAHPAGEQWIDEFAGMDATEVSSNSLKANFNSCEPYSCVCAGEVPAVPFPIFIAMAYLTPSCNGIR
jgi:hypothetical protein